MSNFARVCVNVSRLQADSRLVDAIGSLPSIWGPEAILASNVGMAAERQTE